MLLVSIVSCMRGKAWRGKSVPCDPEIEKTCKKYNSKRKTQKHQERQARQGESSSLQPQPVSLPPCSLILEETPLMAEEKQPQVNLEDYSTHAILQYFTSTARPNVQATNIYYPHSLIQLIQKCQDFLLETLTLSPNTLSLHLPNIPIFLIK